MTLQLRLILMTLSLVYSGCTSSQPINENYYKHLSSDAISAAYVYYSLYEECLKIEKLTEVCEETGKAQPANNLIHVTSFKNKLIEKFNKLYPLKSLSRPTKITNLQEARENFVYETIYLQRKLLIFMARVGKDCGDPRSYDVLTNLGKTMMETYTLDFLIAIHEYRPIKLDDPLFDEYDKSLADSVYKNKVECEYYLGRNKPIYFNSYSKHFDIIKNTPYAERSLTYFLISLIDDL